MALQAALWDALLSLKVQASVYVTVGGQQWLMADDTAAECMSTRWKRLWDYKMEEAVGHRRVLQAKNCVLAYANV